MPVDFLLQQMAYLSEQHDAKVRDKVRKATAATRGSAAPSPVPGGEHPRTTSALSIRRDLPIPQREGGSGATASLAGSGRPISSRNTSANAAVQRDGSGSSGRPPASDRLAGPGGRRRLSSLQPASAEAAHRSEHERATSPGPAESSSTSSDDDRSSPAQSRIIRRPPRFQQQEASQASWDGIEEDDEESEPAFQPYQGQTSAQDLDSTLRGDGRISAGRAPQRSGNEAALQSLTSDSSASSAAIVARPGKAREPMAGAPVSSPRRGVELAGRSPAGKRRATSREGSEGTPSMGSSFSDLDGKSPLHGSRRLLTNTTDASVTQSALEEALASHMNRGAISSRFSIGQAFSGRYMPGSNK